MQAAQAAAETTHPPWYSTHPIIWDKRIFQFPPKTLATFHRCMLRPMFSPRLRRMKPCLDVNSSTPGISYCFMGTTKIQSNSGTRSVSTEKYVYHPAFCGPPGLRDGLPDISQIGIRYPGPVVLWMVMPFEIRHTVYPKCLISISHEVKPLTFLHTRSPKSFSSGITFVSSLSSWLYFRLPLLSFTNPASGS